MFAIQPLRSHPPTRSFRLAPLAAVLMAASLAMAPGPAANAQAFVATPLRWRSSPLVNGQGAPLPPAISYEVWLEENGLQSYLTTTVADTACVLGLKPGVSYRMKVRAVSGAGAYSVFSDYSDPYIPVRPSPVTVQRGDAGGTAVPNPFSDQTVISFRVPESTSASAPPSVEIYDVRGHRLRLFELSGESGVRTITWDGRDADGARMPSGLYLARLRCGSVTTNMKLTLVP